MNEDNECAASFEELCQTAVKSDENGITVKVDKDFQAIEFGLVVQGHPITCFLHVNEAASLVQALNEAIENMVAKCKDPKMSNE